MTNKELIRFFQKYEPVFVASNLKNIPSDAELQSMEIRPRLDEKFENILNAYIASKPRRTAVKVGKRLAIGLVAALLAAAMTLTVSSAAREWFMDIIMDIFSDHTAIQYTPADEEQYNQPFLHYTPSFFAGWL